MVLTRERLRIVKDARHCRVLLVLANGFEEKETITFLSLLRQAGVCIKCVGLTSGLVRGARGICLMPDLTLTDLARLIDIAMISAAILPGGKQCLASLETDPRVHRLLRQIVAQGGQIITGVEGLRVSRAAAVWAGGVGDEQSMPMLLRDATQPLEAFVQDLVCRLG